MNSKQEKKLRKLHRGVVTGMVRKKPKWWPAWFHRYVVGKLFNIDFS